MAVELMETEIAGQIKRKGSESGHENAQKKPRKRNYAGKNALQVLHEEFAPGVPIVFDFESLGNAQAPAYKATLQLEGVRFEGEGNSKMNAKKVVASKALSQLRSIFISPDHPQPEQQQQQQGVQHNFAATPQIDFTSNSFVGAFKQGPDTHRPMDVQPLINPFLALENNPASATPKGIQLLAKRPKIDTEKAQNHPSMVLAEVFPDAVLHWVEGVGRGDRMFKVETEIRGRKFFGEGRNKAGAKNSLSKTILTCLYDIEVFKEEPTEVKAEAEERETTTDKEKKKFPLAELKQTFGKPSAL